MPFLGILFNTEKNDIRNYTRKIGRNQITHFKMAGKGYSFFEIQSLLGKINFVAACVRPGRIFISRLLQWFIVLYHSDMKKHPIPVYVKKDIQSQ